MSREKPELSEGERKKDLARFELSALINGLEGINLEELSSAQLDELRNFIDGANKLLAAKDIVKPTD